MPGEQGRNEGIKEKKKSYVLEFSFFFIETPFFPSLKSTATGNAAYTITIYRIIAQSWLQNFKTVCNKQGLNLLFTPGDKVYILFIKFYLPACT